MQGTNSTLLQSCNSRLKEVLEEIPQFKRKEDLLHMYVAYEFPSQQGYLLKFWEQAMRKVMKGYFGQVCVSADQLRECFILNHFEPSGFNDVLRELISQRVFITSDQLDSYETYKELGLRYKKEVPKQSAFSSLTNMFNPMNLFAKKPELPPLKDLRIIDIETLRMNVKTIIHNLRSLFHEKTIISEEDFDIFLMTQLQYSKDDLHIYKELMVNGGVLGTETIEIGRKRFHIFIYNPNHHDTTAEKTAFVLQHSIEYYAKKIEEMEGQIDQAHQEALKAIQRKNKDQAKQYLKRQRMYQETMKTFIDKKYICEENLLKIESSSSDKEIVSLLQFVKAAHNELRINPDEMFDIAQSMKEAAEERKENRMIIENMANSEDVEDEYKKLERMIMAEDSTESSDKNSNARNQSHQQAHGHDSTIDDLLRQAAGEGENENSMQIEMA